MPNRKSCIIISILVCLASICQSQKHSFIGYKNYVGPSTDVSVPLLNAYVGDPEWGELLVHAPIGIRYQRIIGRVSEVYASASYSKSGLYAASFQNNVIAEAGYKRFLYRSRGHVSPIGFFHSIGISFIHSDSYLTSAIADTLLDAKYAGQMIQPVYRWGRQSLLGNKWIFSWAGVFRGPALEISENHPSGTPVTYGGAGYFFQRSIFGLQVSIYYLL